MGYQQQQARQYHVTPCNYLAFLLADDSQVLRPFKTVLLASKQFIDTCVAFAQVAENCSRLEIIDTGKTVLVYCRMLMQSADLAG